MSEELKKLINFVNPENLKSNLILCSLYIAFFETTKQFVVEQPRSFFSTGFSTESGEIIGPRYKEKVLNKDKKNKLNASLLWFKELGAIGDKEIEAFQGLREYRNILAHEMLERLYDGLDDKFSEQLALLVDFRIKLERWWLFNIEIPTADDDYPEGLSEEDVMTSSQILYRIILDVLSEDTEKANYYYSEFLKKYKELSKNDGQ